MNFAKQLGAALLLLFVVFSGEASADRRRISYHEYGGPKFEFEFTRTRRDSSVCRDRYRNDPRYQACDDGRDASERVAEKYAGYNGRVEGYLRGFSWGLYREARIFENDRQALDAGERDVESLRNHINDGVRDARALGLQRGVSAARQVVLERFNDQANRKVGREPSRNYKAPNSSLGETSDPYTVRVGRIPSINDILRNEREIRYSDLSIYGDTTYFEFLDGRAHIVYRDLWFDDGIYRYQGRDWTTSSAGWKAFSGARSFDRRQYERLGSVMIRERNPDYGRRPQADDRDGGGGNGRGDGGGGGGTPPPPPPEFIEKRVDLKDVFREGFIDSYARFADYYFDINYERTLDDGLWDGRELGENVGRRAAYYRGRRSAFNDVYIRETESAYRDSFQEAFDPSRGEAIRYHDELMSRAELAFEFEGIEGEVNDGILVPGEAVRARLTVKNIGGRAGQFDISLEGRLTNSQTQKLNIGPLTKDDYVSDYIAVIDQGVSAREDIPVALKFNGERSYPRSYKIRQLAEIVRYLPSLDAINGKGQVRVQVQNISNQKLPTTLDLIFKVEGVETSRSVVSMLAGGETQEIVFSTQGHDPLKLIDGRLRTQVDLKMGDTKLFSVTESVGVPSPKEELVSYWDTLLNGGGFIPSNVRRQKRGDDVYNLILRRNIDEIAEWKTGDRDFGGNWKDNPDVTIAGLLKNKRWRYPVIDKKGKIVSGSTSNPNYRALVEAYHSIGTVMLRDRKEFGGFLGISAAKNNYSAIVNQLARGADGRF